MQKHVFLSFDLGATSGRAMSGTIEKGQLEMEEIHRFPNEPLQLHGKYYWNVYSLYESLKYSLKLCAQKGLAIDSIGIDTWGVDFGYIANDGSLLGLPRSYRDPYTQGAPDEFFDRVPRKDVYDLTGIQIMEFNSLFQLFRAKKESFAPLESATSILFMPDLLSYMLTGEKVCEYTVASTSQMLNAKTGRFESRLMEAAGVSAELPARQVMPGALIGYITDALQKETGIGKIPVVAVAGHDTASAVAAVPASDKNFAYLSSGTWSLMGVELEEPIISEESFKHNFTNEGGIDGTIRFLKNITGMWLLERFRKEREKEGRDYSYPDIVRMAREAAPFRSFVNPDDPRFANPDNMTETIAAYCREKGQPVPENDAAYIRCIFESLALRYKETLKILQAMAPHTIERLHVIGGGAKNDLLNQFTADAIGIPVTAGPSEATAIGNCMIQAKAAGVVKDRWSMRKMIADTYKPTLFIPQNSDAWAKAFEDYKRFTSN